MSPLLSCLAATTWGILSVLVASCFKVSLILLRNSSGVFRRSSAVASGLPNLTMISLSLLPAMMEVGEMGGCVGGPGPNPLSPGGDPTRGLYCVVDCIFDEGDV